MSLHDKIEAYRSSCAMRLRHDRKDRSTVKADLLAKLAKLEKDDEATKAQLDRAEHPLPAATICPRCWIDRGLQIPLQRIAADNDDDPARRRLVRCTGPSCEWETDAAN